MALISVITPTNSLSWLTQAWKSMKRQALQDWEWVVVLNGDILEKTTSDECRAVVGYDARVRFFPFEGKKNDDGSINVGALKKKACEHVNTEFAVEFDHDDELSVDCLEEVYKAFTSTSAVFVFSDSVRLNSDGKVNFFGSYYGWEYSQRQFQGDIVETYPVATHPLAVPQNVTRIWYAPDHVRAWRMKAYVDVKGHDETMKVCDDLDLMCKLYRYSGGNFHHIQKVLYKYLIHGENTWLKNMKLIEELMWGIHDRNIQDFALMFWKQKNLRCLDLGGGINPPPGWEGVDVHDAAVVANLEEPWPFSDNSVGALRAQDFIEHIHPPKVIHVMNEAYRVLHHGGLFLIEVPSTDGRGAFQDPSHVSFWNSNSFWYYTQARLQKYVKHLGANCRFQVVRMVNYFPSDFHKLHNIVYTKAHLAAIKDGPRLHGAYEI